MQILQPPSWPRPRGYSNGVMATGRMVFVAGQVGWDNSTAQFRTDDLVGQVRQALVNIVAVLAEAGGNEYLARADEIGRAYREVIGKHFPAMTALQIRGFVEPAAKVEIEVTAI